MRFKNNNPDIPITAVNVTKDIERMIAYVQAAYPEDKDQLSLPGFNNKP